MDGIIITARLKSKRLPKKAIIKINNKSLINYLIDRIKYNTKIPIFICTSTNIEDDPLINIAKENKINYFRGDEEDVLKRYYDCCRQFNLDKIYIVYADEPFIDIDLLKLTFKQVDSRKAVFVRNDQYIDGVFGYGFNFKCLRIVNNLKSTNQNEVWGEMVSKMPINLIINPFPYNIDKNEIRLSVDYKDDLEVFKKIILSIGEKFKEISILEIFKLYKSLDLFSINGSRIKDYNSRIKEQSI